MDEACRTIAGSLARSLVGKTVAVMPFADSDDGIRRLGVVLSEGVERELLAAKVQMIDRSQLDKLMDATDVNLAAGDPDALAQVPALAKVDALVVGRTVFSGRDVVVSAKACAVGKATGRVLAAPESLKLDSAPLDELAWYVRRPDGGNGGELPALTLRYEFISPSPLSAIRVADGDIVRSGQRFKIRVRSNSDCYLYVLLYDSRGAASVLFPHTDIALSNAVRGEATIEIPEAGKWYWFDDNPGTETFYLVASYAPLGDLDGMLVKLRQNAGDRQLAARTKDRIENVLTRGMKHDGAEAYAPKGFVIRSRGVGGVVEAGRVEPLDTGSPAPDLATGHATVVRKVTLKHR
jgi:Domain of unknown function (DUF4384)